MIKKYLIPVLIILSLTHRVTGQGTNNKVKLHSITSLGLLNGSKGTSLAIQTIFGAAYHKSFLGVGLGLDYYGYRTIPLFADFRHEFGKGDRNLFVYGDLGYHYDWLAKDKVEQIYNYQSQERFSGGLYYDVGVGYKVGLSKSDALILSGGYTFKKLQSEFGNDDTCPLIGPCYSGLQTYRYYLSRLILKVGYRF